MSFSEHIETNVLCPMYFKFENDSSMNNFFATIICHRMPDSWYVANNIITVFWGSDYFWPHEWPK